MQPGTEFQCEIEKCALGGDGLTRVGGEVIFIRGTLPGEKLIARAVAAKKNFSRAEIVRFGSKSPDRIEPACPHFGRCPGCSYQHCSYGAETAIKAEQLRDALNSAGIEPAPGVWREPVAPLPEAGYRNKLEFHAHKVGKEIFFGYVASDNVTVTDIDACPLAHPEINELLAKVRCDKSFLHSLHEGMRVTFRRTAPGGAVYWRNQPARNLTWLREEVPFGELSVPCGSFFQVNPAGGAALIEEFSRTLDELRPARVIDLYCGAGLFGAAAAAKGYTDISGVESDEAAAAAARFNWKKFGIAEPDVTAGDAGTALKSLGLPAGTLLVVDPPRTGLAFPAVKAVNESALRHLVYVSCHPATWSRDAARLRKGGFELRALRMVNMFPRTGHFEIFSQWSRD